MKGLKIGAGVLIFIVFACSERKTVTKVHHPLREVFVQTDEFVIGPRGDEAEKFQVAVPHSVTAKAELVGSQVKISLTPQEPCAGLWDVRYRVWESIEGSGWGDQERMSGGGLEFFQKNVDLNSLHLFRIYCRLWVKDPSRPELVNGFQLAVSLKRVVADFSVLKTK